MLCNIVYFFLIISYFLIFAQWFAKLMRVPLLGYPAMMNESQWATWSTVSSSKAAWCIATFCEMLQLLAEVPLALARYWAAGVLKSATPPSLSWRSRKQFGPGSTPLGTPSACHHRQQTWQHPDPHHRRREERMLQVTHAASLASGMIFMSPSWLKSSGVQSFHSWTPHLLFAVRVPKTEDALHSSLVNLCPLESPR